MSTEETGPATDEIHIRSVLRAFAAAWNRHDVNAFSASFANDADFTNVLGVSAHGRTQIAAFHRPLFATVFRDSSLRVAEVRVRFIRPDVAAIDEEWEMTGARDGNGQSIPLRRGLLNLIMTKQQADWLICVMHNMELPPEQSKK